MLIEVVQLRATGMKLTRDEIAEAPPGRGNLTITKDGTGYVHLRTKLASHPPGIRQYRGERCTKK